jgi:proteasome lid subunit RPN8/RPN11
MLETSDRLDTGTWESGGIEVEYSLEVLEQLRRISVDGHNAFVHGGKEVGGILYGVREGERIRVVSSTELACEHALGPRFLLSDADRESLAALLHSREELEAVGWFRSHTRGGLDLDSSDRDLFDRYFAQPLSVALILKPTHWGPATAAFFVREPSGTIEPPAASEFALVPLKTAAPAAPPMAEESSLPAPPPTPVVTPVRPAPPTVLTRGMRIWTWALCAVALLAVASLVSYALRPVPHMNLQAYAVAPGQVRIEWNHGSRGLPDGTSGLLQVVDGGAVTRIPIDAGHLRSGSVTYVQKTDHVSVRLKVEGRSSGSAPMEDSVEFVGALPPPVQAAAPAVQAPAAAPPPPPVIVMEVPVKPAPVQATPPPPVPVQVAHRQLQASAIPEPRRAASAPTQIALPVPPPVEPGPARPMSLPDFLSGTALRASGGAPMPPVRSGRLIWTGGLARKGVVEIDGVHASIGSLAGALPGLPVALRVLPGEFSRGGLIVYTIDRARAGKSERASKSNGWNATEFRLDDTRARQVVILEAPNRANDFKRLVLRNDGRDCPVVLVDWSIE